MRSCLRGRKRFGAADVESQFFETRFFEAWFSGERFAGAQFPGFAAVIAFDERLAWDRVGRDVASVDIHGEIAHHLFRGGFRQLSEELRGELQAVEIEAGLARLEAAGAEGGEDLADGHLNAAGVFERGQIERLALGALPILHEALQVVMEVAVNVAVEGGRFALCALGQDVATFDDHGGAPWKWARGTLPPRGWGEIPRFLGAGAKISGNKELAANAC